MAGMVRFDSCEVRNWRNLARLIWAILFHVFVPRILNFLRQYLRSLKRRILCITVTIAPSLALTRLTFLTLSARQGSRSPCAINWISRLLLIWRDLHPFPAQSRISASSIIRLIASIDIPRLWACFLACFVKSGDIGFSFSKFDRNIRHRRNGIQRRKASLSQRSPE